MGLLHSWPARACIVPHPVNPSHMLEGADFEYKLSNFFKHRGPPPLEEVFFVTQNISRATQDELMKTCPGLLVVAFVLLAEVRTPVSPVEANDALAKADRLAGRLSRDEYEDMVERWHLGAAMARYQQAATAAQAGMDTMATPLSLHIVVAHCRESLMWLVDGTFHLPAPTHVDIVLFIYEKCGKHAELEPLLQAQRFAAISVVEVDDAGTRRDECSAYLHHLVKHYDDIGDFTVFFQADAGDHLQWNYLSLVMRSVELRTLDPPFVHLDHPRLVASLSPCREEVFRLIFGRAPKAMLGAYCCAQFLVSRERVHANPLERYQRMLEMLYSESPAACSDIPGRSTQCLMFEVYWHVLFGEEDELAERAENEGLPLFLRIRDMENESYLPPGSLYLAHVLDGA